MAKDYLPRGVFDFFDGGAEDEISLRENRRAFEEISIVPRVLVDVSNPDLGTSIVGTPAALPFVVAPTGGIGMGWPQADVEIARAAAERGIPYTLSTTATSSIETVAERAGGRLWFQLYVLKDKPFLVTLIQRAAAAGYEGLVVTLDLAVGGKRERDLRNRYTIPFRPGPGELLDVLRHPAWLLRFLRSGGPDFANLRGFQGFRSSGATIAALVGQNLDASFSWDEFAAIRELWPGKLLAKGVEHPDDARRLVEMGVDALWISNHGGRQLDGAIAPLRALPAIAQAASGRVPIIVDSGVRRGVDAMKAIALGAQAVAFGRPLLYGVSVGGLAGARRALDILSDELRRSMQLSGVRRLSEISESLLSPQRLPHPYIR